MDLRTGKAGSMRHRDAGWVRSTRVATKATRRTRSTAHDRRGRPRGHEPGHYHRLDGVEPCEVVSSRSRPATDPQTAAGPARMERSGSGPDTSSEDPSQHIPCTCAH